MIKYAQIDPNGLCNAKCWFCPVAYTPNPKVGRVNMTLETLESILQQLRDGTGTFVDPNLTYIFPFHYNEVMLYPHFEEMLVLYKKYEFKTSISSNGTTLTPERTDIIKKYPGVVDSITLNIPSPFASEWSSLTGMNESIYNKLRNNLDYVVKELKHMWQFKNIGLQVNGVHPDATYETNGLITLLKNAPKVTTDVEANASEFRRLYPEFDVVVQKNLIDRAGYLDKVGVMTNAKGIQDKIKGNNTKVIGCSSMGSRPDDWVHISASGDVFLCCNDYEFETTFGNIHTTPLADIWASVQRQEMITKSYDTFCTSCAAAIWG